MQLDDKQQLLTKFFYFEKPNPFDTHFTEEELKNNDMKITLEIATHSNLRMQSDTKTNLVSFSCKKYGKCCFQIFATKIQNYYVISTNYEKVNHERQCELHQESFEYLKIYNLMKLKKNHIQEFMIKRNLFNSSPSQILSQISSQGEYFFQKNINYNPQMRRKLRKRFDNIINIDIKKITKGGRDSNYEGESEVLKQVKNLNNSQKNINNCSEDQADVQQFHVHRKIKNKKSKGIKKKQKLKKKQINLRQTNYKKEQKQNIQNGMQQEICFPKSCERIQSQIYINPASEQQLKQIKELRQQFNWYGDIFSWSSENQHEGVQLQTINDKLRQNVFMSLRNSLMKRSLQTQSIQNIENMENIGNLDDWNEDEI